jgi:hypothetical protein
MGDGGDGDFWVCEQGCFVGELVGHDEKSLDVKLSGSLGDFSLHVRILTPLSIGFLRAAM